MTVLQNEAKAGLFDPHPRPLSLVRSFLARERGASLLRGSGCETNPHALLRATRSQSMWRTPHSRLKTIRSTGLIKDIVFTERICVAYSVHPRRQSLCHPLP